MSKYVVGLIRCLHYPSKVWQHVARSRRILPVMTCAFLLNELAIACASSLLRMGDLLGAIVNLPSSVLP